jgi:plasmid stabilization system protein ParE
VQILIKNPEAGSILAELRAGGWRKLIYRRWKVIYAIRGEDIIVGRVWPAAKLLVPDSGGQLGRVFVLRNTLLYISSFNKNI